MTTTTHTDQRPDVHEMVVVHRAFRRESGAAAGYIRTTPEGDTRRAKVVADHLRLGLAGLHMHHTGEDVILWPLLLERAAPSTGLVETMQAQHHGVDARTEALIPALAAWEAAPTAAKGDQLAGLVDEFTAALVEQMCRLPVHVTADIEDGYSDDPADVAETVAHLAALGRFRVQ